MNLTYDNILYQFDDDAQCKANINMLDSFFEKGGNYSAQQHTEEENLDVMEKIDSAMKICGIYEDMKKLSVYMRQQEALINYGEESGYDSLEFLFFEMQFQRFNGLLYRQYKQPVKALECYEKAFELEKECLLNLKIESDRTKKEKEFIAWSLHEVVNEAATCAESLVNRDKAEQFLAQDLEILNWGENFFNEGLLLETAELYGGIGGSLLEKGYVQDGKRLYEKSIELFERLAKVSGNLFIESRGLWMMSRNVLSVLQYGGGGDIASECEKRVNTRLMSNAIDDMTRGVLLGTNAAIKMYKMNMSNEPGQERNAINIGLDAVVDAVDALEMLEKIYKNENGRTGIFFWTKRVCSQIYMLIITLYWSLGLMDIQIEDLEGAEDVFKECLKYINEDPYGQSNVALAIFSTDAYCNLAVIASGKNDKTKMDFYGNKCMQDTEEALKSMLHPMLMFTRIKCACYMAEMYLNIRDKKVAEVYAKQGLDTCTVARNNQVQVEGLAKAESLLEKFYKKATRKFF